MTSISGRPPQLPDRLLTLVFGHAQRFGRAVASDDLFLLALTELDPGQPARRALAEEGIDTERLLTEIRMPGDQPPVPATGMTFAPANYLMHGRAQGFAAALGDGAVTPEHVLLALLWDPSALSCQVLDRLGVRRQRILDRLRDLDVPAPTAALPPERAVDMGEPVWFGRAEAPRVLDHLRLHISPDTRWGFNYDGERAWVFAESHVELDLMVKAALAGRSHPPS